MAHACDLAGADPFDARLRLACARPSAHGLQRRARNARTPAARDRLLAFVLAGVLHMEVGMRSIVVDYIHGPARAWALLANTCFCALLALACAYATLRIAFT